MDNLTHTAVGLFLSRVGLNRWTPVATPIVLLSANAPDIDVLSGAAGSVSYLHYHRHLTHSLIAIPAMAILCVVVVRAFTRKQIRWAAAVAAAGIGLLSHVLLDLTNVYGVRLLLPFSARWLRLDITNVFDLWIWGVFLLAIAAPFVSRLVGTEITPGARARAPHGRTSAWLALTFLIFYDCGRAALHSRAAAMIDARIYHG